MEKDFEQQLIHSFNREIEIPKSVLDKAEVAFAEIRRNKSQTSKNKFRLGKKYWIAAAVALVLLGLTFNQPVIAALKAVFWGEHTGVKKAVENGFKQEVQTPSVKTQGVEAKVTDLLVDKSRIGLSLHLKFDDIELSKKLERLFVDIVITDENGRIISGEGFPEQCMTGYEDSTDIANRNVGEFTYHILETSNTASIPRINKLNIQIREIALFNSKSDPSFKQIKGDWKFSIALDEKFTKANEVAYICQSSNNEDITILSAETLPAGFVIKYIVNNPLADQSDYLDERIGFKVQLLDSKGNSYGFSNSLSSDVTKDNKYLISMPFEVTNYDQIDSLKFIVKDLNGRDFEAILVKKQ